MKKKIIVSNIDWYQEDDGSRADLPDTVEIGNPDPSLFEDIDGEAENLAEYLSDAYGYLVNGFAVAVEGV